MRIEYCKKCGTQKGKKYSPNGFSTMTCRNCDTQDEIQEDTTSMEEKLEALNEDVDQRGKDESECCGAGTNGDYRICEACGEHC
jgi:hypothetical protein